MARRQKMVIDKPMVEQISIPREIYFPAYRVAEKRVEPLFMQWTFGFGLEGRGSIQELLISVYLQGVMDGNNLSTRKSSEGG